MDKFLLEKAESLTDASLRKISSMKGKLTNSANNKIGRDSAAAQLKTIEEMLKLIQSLRNIIITCKQELH